MSNSGSQGGSGLGDTVRQTTGNVAGTVQGAASNVAGTVQGAASNVAGQAQYQAQRAQGWYSRTLAENPMVLGAAALALGAIIGVSIPETDQENQLLGGQRDQLVQRAQSKTRDLVGKAQHVAQTATSAAKQDAQQQGLSSTGATKTK